MIREEIKSKIESLFSTEKYSEEEFEIMLKFHLNEPLIEREQEILNELYYKKIAQQKLAILSDKKIYTLVSCVSLSKILPQDYLELPIFKSLRVFKEIKNIYLLYTNESEFNFKEISEKLKRFNINVIGKAIKNDTIDDIYTTIRDLAIKGEINKENTIFDITLGLKMSGIAFYKLASERGFISINWKELQLPIYNYNEKNSSYEETNFGKRIPLTVTLELLKEPLKESMKTYTMLNEALENKEYNVVSSHFKNIGNDDISFFFEKLAQLFTFENISSLDYKKFFNGVEEFLKNIFLYPNFTDFTKERIKEFLASLLVLISFEQKDRKTLIQKEFSWLNNSEFYFPFTYIQKQGVYFINQEADILDITTLLKYRDDKLIERVDVEDIDDFEEEIYYKKEIYFYLVLEYFYSKIKDRESNSFLQFFKKSILKEFGISLSGKSDLINRLTLDDFIKIIFYKCDLEDLEEYDKEDIQLIKNALNFLNICEIFKEDPAKEIELKDYTLKILKYNIEINLLEEEEMKEAFNKRGKKLQAFAQPIVNFINSTNINFKLTEKNIYEYDIDENREKTSKGLKKDFSRFKTKVVLPLNSIVDRELKKRGIISEEFINFNSRERAFTINSDFYIR
ncbi:MAG: hypothetical protein SOR11_09430 [Fusobacterium sp.]|uniref:hypothetical protein n=1 Tax=Fusobacterium sp. TaxID=68766 RepID=UPI002A75DC74|nr:hypothetical protein [Fusobacterium sp.]MDY3060199.1 hypothetical protein [Fusobacterium sp.]